VASMDSDVPDVKEKKKGIVSEGGACSSQKTKSEKERGDETDHIKGSNSFGNTVTRQW
jgi:hypothetical protein